MRRTVFWGDLGWAVYLLALAMAFGLFYHHHLVGLAWRGELPAYLAKQRQEQRKVRFQGVKTLNLAQAHNLWQKKEALFIDARKAEDYNELHIEGSLNLPPDSWKGQEFTGPKDVPQDRSIVVYCSQEACNDALKLAEKLQSLGFAQVAVYLGGFQHWDEAGYPVGTRR